MKLIEMSVSGAVMILAILIIRALFLKKLPKRMFPILWSVALARLLIPYSLPSAFSVYSLFAQKETAQQAPNITNIVPPPVYDLPPQSASDIPARAETAPMSISINEVVMFVWSAGVLALAAFFAVSYLKCVRRFRESLPVDSGSISKWLSAHPLCREISVRCSDRITSPLTYGIFRPVILLPKTASTAEPTDLEYVLFHEYVHIRRFDLSLKLLLIAALCVHWFDPLAWVMFIFANRDIEISCDEAVLRHFGEQHKQDYAMALIRMEEKRSGTAPLTTRFSKRPIEERIVNIMKFKKATTISVIAAVFLTLGTTAAFATTAKTDDEPAKQPSAVTRPAESAESDTQTSKLPDTSDSSETSDNSSEEPSSGADTSSLPAASDNFANDPRIPEGQPYQVKDNGDQKIVYVGWDEDDIEHKGSSTIGVYTDATFVYRLDGSDTPYEPVEEREYTNCSFTGEVYIYW